VIHFFSFTGRKEMNKSKIARMLDSSNNDWYIKKIPAERSSLISVFNQRHLRENKLPGKTMKLILAIHKG
jgi:hypothetical protein